MFSRRSQSDNLILVLPVVKKIDQAAEVNSRKDNRKNCWIVNRINSYCRKAAVSDTAGTTSNQSNSRRVKSNRLGCTTTHQLGGNGIKNPPARKQSPAWNKLPTRQVTGICHSFEHQLGKSILNQLGSIIKYQSYSTVEEAPTYWRSQIFTSLHPKTNQLGRLVYSPAREKCVSLDQSASIPVRIASVILSSETGVSSCQELEFNVSLFSLLGKTSEKNQPARISSFTSQESRQTPLNQIQTCQTGRKEQKQSEEHLYSFIQTSHKGRMLEFFVPACSMFL